MKTRIAIFACIVMVAAALMGGTSESKDVLRIHIRAKDDSIAAQQIKYAVKDAVVAYMTPLLAECDTIEKVRAVTRENLDDIVGVCNAVLCENAANYRASASIRREEFPTRAYGDLVLEAGEYDSLIIELGEGEGQNWWCVLYPPLCFVPESDGTGNVSYRSKILEIINDYLGG